MIIVTGANGFIGSAMMWELNNQGVRDLLAVDRVPPGVRPALLSSRQYLGFRNAKEFLGAMDSRSVDPSRVRWVIHLGACSDTTETRKHYLDEVNLHYSQAIWRWCTEFQIPLIYASSAATYGAGEKGFSDLTPPTELKAMNLYGESKREFDGWVLQQTQAPPAWYGLKFFNVYGPQEHHKGAMASLVQKAVDQIRQTGRLKLFRSHRSDFADGRQMRDFVYVKDVTRWMWELMQERPRSGIYNMGSGSARTWLDLAGGVFDTMGLPQKIEWIDMPMSIRDQYQYWTEADMNRFFGLGLSRVQWPLELGIRDYVAEYLIPERLL